MDIVLRPMMGYPFTLGVEVEYRLGRDGLRVRTTATNIGDATCPSATGQHPYISAGAEHMQAALWLPTDERGIPQRVAAVDGTHVDFRTGRQIGDEDIDYTFTDLSRDPAGVAWVGVTRADGRRISVWVDEHYPYVEIYTSHTQPNPHWHTGLGVEPMTAPPNAFQSGVGLIRLEPGESATTRWGIGTD